jgi:hypothetical protein
MKTMKRIATTMLLLLFASWLAAQDAERPNSHLVQIDSSPRGAEVYSGDSLLGRTPCSLPLALARGAVAYWPGRASWSAGSRTLPDSLLTAERGVILLHFDAMRMLRSIPSGAAVFDGDSLLGYTPVEVRVDQSRVLRLEKPGYGSVKVDAMEAATGPAVTLPAGDGAPVGIFRDAQGEGSPAVQRHTPGLDLPPLRIWLPAAGGIAAGAAAVYFKQHANEQYARYLLSGDETLLSETEKYDIYAGVSLAVLQIGLAYFVYLLFTEH